ncbi:hypothetical protein KY334_02150, partial [Candidatus Woesearchaeota archaeon]|nr:hypothetical protein [Candidatus Woesearchaeota archaeon]
KLNKKNYKFNIFHIIFNVVFFWLNLYFAVSNPFNGIVFVFFMVLIVRGLILHQKYKESLKKAEKVYYDTYKEYNYKEYIKEIRTKKIKKLKLFH